jgi:hypothetical protein
VKRRRDLRNQAGGAGGVPNGVGRQLFTAGARAFRALTIRWNECGGRRLVLATAGVKFGRKPKLSAYQRQEAIKRRAAGETLAEIAKSYAVDVSMISRLQA